MEETVTVPRKLIERAAQCLARAEAEGAFKDCVVPSVGSKTLAWLESHLYEKES